MLAGCGRCPFEAPHARRRPRASVDGREVVPEAEGLAHGYTPPTCGGHGALAGHPGPASDPMMANAPNGPISGGVRCGARFMEVRALV